jgi:hypothetical protein
MKILDVEKRKETLYIGLVEGKEYEGLISPASLGGIDSHIDKTVEIDVTVTLFELNGEKYYTVIGTDVNGEIVYTDIQENK